MVYMPIEEKLKKSSVKNVRTDEKGKNLEEKCIFIIYNLLKIHHDTIKRKPRLYLYDFFETAKCDEVIYGKFNSTTKTFEENKENSAFSKTEMKIPQIKKVRLFLNWPIAEEVRIKLKYNRERYIAKLGENNVKNILEEYDKPPLDNINDRETAKAKQDLSNNEMNCDGNVRHQAQNSKSSNEKRIEYITAHYYEWNRSCLEDCLLILSKRKYLCYLFEREQNNAIVSGSFGIIGVVIGLFGKRIIGRSGHLVRNWNIANRIKSSRIGKVIRKLLFGQNASN